MWFGYAAFWIRGEAKSALTHSDERKGYSRLEFLQTLATPIVVLGVPLETLILLFVCPSVISVKHSRSSLSSENRVNSPSVAYL